MKETGWKDIVELIGIVAIVASLIFVGLQLKQSHEIASSQIYQERTSTTVAAAIAVATNPLMTSLIAKAESGQSDAITAEELVAADFHITATAMLWDNSHYQHTKGYIDADGWARIRNDIKSSLRNPLIRQRISEVIEGGNARPQVAEVYKQVMRELDEENKDHSSKDQPSCRVIVIFRKLHLPALVALSAFGRKATLFSMIFS